MTVLTAGRQPATSRTILPASAKRRTLWSAEDVTRGVLVLAAGGIIIAVSWYVCSGDASFNHQIGPLDAAVSGMLLAGLGNLMWLMRGRRVVGERRRALLPDPEMVAIEPVGTVRKVSDLSAQSNDAKKLFLAGEGLVHFHRPECALASDRSWSGATRAEHEEHGRQPCGVCRP
jgi:hypothetical protein